MGASSGLLAAAEYVSQVLVLYGASSTNITLCSASWSAKTLLVSGSNRCSTAARAVQARFEAHGYRLPQVLGCRNIHLVKRNACLKNACAMQARFEAAGYKLPQLVFWNLEASRIGGQKSTPVQFNKKGVALVSGFSGQLLKLFMDKPGGVEAWKVDPELDAAAATAAACPEGSTDTLDVRSQTPGYSACQDTVLMPGVSAAFV